MVHEVIDSTSTSPTPQKFSCKKYKNKDSTRQKYNQTFQKLMLDKIYQFLANGKSHRSLSLGFLNIDETFTFLA